MFKQRAITAFILVLLVLGVLLYGQGWMLGLGVLAIVLLGGNEWSRLVPLTNRRHQLIFLLCFCLSLGVQILWFPLDLNLGLILWGAIFLAVITFPRTESVWGYPFLVGLTCYILLPLFALSVWVLYQLNDGRALLLYAFCLVWASDTGAYLVGKRWGVTKFIPRVSPGKSVEGSLGGVILAMGVAFVGERYFKPHSAFTWYILAVGTAFMSMLGDLFMSMLKRRCKLKDTGNLFPGHGGVLDRIDGLIAGVPFFLAVLTGSTSL